MNPKAVTLLALGLVLLSSLMPVAEGAESLRAETTNNITEWQERLNESGILVESRPFPGQKHQEFRATLTLTATPASVIALLQDNDACSRWLFRCEESRLLDLISNQERYFYQVTDLPFPAKSRDVIFHATLEYQDNGGIRVNVSSAPDHIEETGHVRIRHAIGYYLVEPVSDSSTRVTWQQYINPAGSLPGWLVNSMLTDLPFKSLQNMRQLVTEPPYAEARFSYDENGLPDGIVMGLQ